MVKLGAVGVGTEIRDDTPIEVDFSPQSLKDYAADFGLLLTDSQLASVKMPAKSTKAKALVQWLDKFITVASCINPKDGKLQIELCGLDELYLMYVNDFKEIHHEKYLGKSQFKKLFKEVFGPMVQVRKKKSVTGKCQICALLSWLRMRSKSPEEIESVSKLHAIHKIGFMGDYTKLTRSYLKKLRLVYFRDQKTMEELTQFENKFPNTKSSAMWVKDHKKDFYVPFKDIFCDFSKVSADILPMKYLGCKTKHDKDILREYKVIEDKDTVKRSGVIVKDDARLYYEVKQAPGDVQKRDW